MFPPLRPFLLVAAFSQSLTSKPYRLQEEQAGPSSPAGDAAPGSTNGSSTSAEQEDEALDKLFRDPAVQEMLYQHLPETMRNKETFDWMLNNPEYRKQLQDVLKKQVGLSFQTLILRPTHFTSYLFYKYSLFSLHAEPDHLVTYSCPWKLTNRHSRILRYVCAKALQSSFAL